MAQKHRRYTLKAKESKQILAQASQKSKLPLETVFGEKASVEVAESEVGEIILINGKPALFKLDNTFYPTLNATELIARLPKAVVDMGAVRFVCNGADVMAPGVVRYEGNFAAGDVVVVVDVTHGKPLALGEALRNSDEARATKQGPVVKTKHYVSDKVWGFAKALIE